MSTIQTAELLVKRSLSFSGLIKHIKSNYRSLSVSIGDEDFVNLKSVSFTISSIYIVLENKTNVMINGMGIRSCYESNHIVTVSMDSGINIYIL